MKKCVDCFKELPKTEYHFRPDERATNAEAGYWMNYCKIRRRHINVG